VAIPHHLASGSMNYGIIHAMYYGLFVPSMCWRKLLRNAYKGGLYLRARQRENREYVQECGEKESCNGSSLAAIAAAASAVKMSWSRVERSDPPPPCICFVSFL